MSTYDSSSRTGRLAGKTAIITGSTGRGLGTEMARLFASEAANVVVTGRNVERGTAVVEEIAAAGGEATFIAADLSREEDVNHLVEATVSAYGALHVLVNNAVSTNQGNDNTVVDVSLDLWNDMMRVNVYGPVLLCRAAIPAMITAGGGSIVNIGSRTAVRGTPQLSAYSTSKAALHGLTRSIAVDFAAQGIRCNTVSPGFITGKDREELTPERRQWAEAMHLTKPPTTTEVALAALYFASDESASITAEELKIDGGGSMARGLTLG
jgi:NAD(P)-dependent dehydrogenase (short-subunit alcohol dehydrogenase family)